LAHWTSAHGATHEARSNSTETQLNQSLIQAEFWKDYIASIKQHLLKAGMSFDGTENHEKIFIAFYNRVARELPPRPRSVHSPKNFLIPAEHQSAITDIQREITNGTNLNPSIEQAY
jgi:hypothetical protein